MIAEINTSRLQDLRPMEAELTIGETGGGKVLGEKCETVR
jgi:hypothetical protein